MQDLITQLKAILSESVIQLYGKGPAAADILIEPTRKGIEGDFTVIVFALTRFSKKSPEETATELGVHLEANESIILGQNTIKGFLNLVILPSVLLPQMDKWVKGDFGLPPPRSGKKVVVEYCGPNTNKPLHLGHIRNMVIGYAVSEILTAAGEEVHRVNIYNDRGIAICKSMVAWVRDGKKATPQSTGEKGDHLVGRYYIAYDQLLKKEIADLIEDGGVTEEEAGRKAPIFLEAQDMLRRWEGGDKETLAIWAKMNEWVYEGFEKTFNRLGVDFEKHYHESAHYLSGKTLVEEGLAQNSFFKKDDGSVWVDLTNAGLDEKVLLRNDGTSVYLTQDLGTAEARYADYSMDQSIYVVADEQDYHFKALKATLQKLGKPYADGIFHLSYGMVDLPTGKMKSREGTTVDADELMTLMNETAMRHTEELGKIEGLTEAQAHELYEILGLGALKFHLLRVNPRKRILFNPEESIAFQGDTGPFVQYTHARIASLLRKSEKPPVPPAGYDDIKNEEKGVMILLDRFASMVQSAAAEYDPSQVTSYLLDLAKAYNKFYAELSVLGADKEEQRQFRLALSAAVREAISKGMAMLGTGVPERM